MALIGINTRDITSVTVFDGISPINISGLLTSANASYSPLSIPEQGVIYITGNVELTQAADAIDFDDRYSSFWKRGNRITITYAEPDIPATEYPYPIIGTTYITSTQYDFKSTLNIDIGCILSLLNKLTPQDLGICIEIGDTSSVADAAINLLVAAGVPSDGSDVFAAGVNHINTTSFNNLLSGANIIEPITVEQGQSIIETASNLVAPYGVFFYQRNDGLVTLTRWSDFSSKGLILSKRARDLHVYDRSGSFDSMIKKLVATYNFLTLCEESTTQNQEVISGNTRTTVEVVRDNVNRIITRTTREYRTVGSTESLVSRTTETSTYEAEPAESQSLIRIGQALPNGDCFPEDRARLLTKITETVIDNTEYLRAWLANKNIAGQVGGSGFPSSFSPNAGTPDPEFIVSGVNISQQTTETWTYSTDTQIYRVVDTLAPQGQAIPLTGDLKLGQVDGRPTITDRDPNELVVTNRITEIYTRSDNACEGWKQTIDVREIQYANDPEFVNSQAEDATTVLETITGDAYLLVQTSFTTNNNIGEPNPESFPPEKNIAATEVELIYGGDNPSFPFDVVQNTFLGNYFDFPQDEINKLGSQIMNISNGRVQGMIIADSPFEVAFECWPDVVPLSFIKVIEPYRDRASIFVADSPSITINPSETVIGCTGIFLGFQSDPAEINDKTNLTFNQGINIPPSDPEAITIPSVALSGNYSLNIGET